MIGLCIQLFLAAVAASSRQLVQSAVQESARLSTSVVGIIEQNLDICFDSEVPAPLLSTSAEYTAQLLGALAGGNATMEAITSLLQPQPPAMGHNSWKLPGWALLLAGVALQRFTGLHAVA